MCKKLKELENNYPFLKEVDSCSLRNSIFNLEDSYENYFEKRSNYPKFKSKFNKQSFRTICIRSSYKKKEYSNIQIDLIKRKIKLPKLGLIDIRGYRNLKSITGRIINATVEKETTNKYYVSVIIEEKETILENIEPTNIVGIDLGIKDLVVTSDGEKYKNKKEIEKHEKGAGKYYYQVDTYYSSSKICSHCSNKTEVTNNLSIRKWKCENCGNENDRDINASINIMFEGLKLQYQN